MGPERKKKKKWVTAGAVGLAVLLVAGSALVLKGNAEPVNVYSFSYIGMTEYWGDSRESYGTVTTDKIQTVFLSDTQTVTEILVQPGDMVKKGDVLLSYDTTLDDLALERKRLEVEKQKLQLTDARARLQEIWNMEPMELPDYEDVGDGDETADLGTALTDRYRLSTQSAYDGSTPETALICWLNSDAVVDDALLETIRQQAERFQNREKTGTASSASEIPEEGILEEEPIPEESVPVESEPPASEPVESAPTDPSQPPAGEGTGPEQEEDPEDPPLVIGVEDYYVVIKVTAGNMSLGAVETWQGLHVFSDGAGGFVMRFFNAAAVPDHTMVQQDDFGDADLPQMDLGSGFTAAQIAQMRSEQEKRIRELEISIKMTEAEYKIMQTELNDGRVCAQIDGEVVTVLEEEEAKTSKQPIVKVSDEGGFYVEVDISELERESIQPGQEVTINDWNTGMTHTAEVISVGEFPTDGNGWNGMGNPNVSYYPFRVFVDGSADLQEGSMVSVVYSSGGGENGVYLDNAFIRTEQGSSYVYLRGANGKLEKRNVTVGKSLWGSYKEIRSGVTEEDYLAFPFGKEVKDGAPTVEADISQLYAY